jgi:hypothetical protein
MFNPFKRNIFAILKSIRIKRAIVLDQHRNPEKFDAWIEDSCRRRGYWWDKSHIHLSGWFFALYSPIGKIQYIIEWFFEYPYICIEWSRPEGAKRFVEKLGYDPEGFYDRRKRRGPLRCWLFRRFGWRKNAFLAK